MGLWKTVLGIGVLAGAAVAGFRLLEKLEAEKDGTWTLMDGGFDGEIEYAEPAERAKVYGSGPIVYPPQKKAAHAPEDAVQRPEFIDIANIKSTDG
ncbi:MAG: hypothetical protein RR825_06050 [Ruthenibacterium sp.]